MWNVLDMSIFVNIIQVFIDFFSQFTLSSQDKQLAVVLIQVDFENKLISKHNATGHWLWAWYGFKQRILFWYHRTTC